MKIYQLILKLKSDLLTELQSDTIYGHFCWRLKDKFGDTKLGEFISMYKNGAPVFLVSDGFLRLSDGIHFPRPLVLSNNSNNGMVPDKYKKILDFVQRKKSKERDYLLLDELNEFLSSGKVNIDSEKQNDNNRGQKRREKPIIQKNLRVSVQIDRNTNSAMEGRLFSYEPVHIGQDASFVVLIKVLDEESFTTYDCESIFREIFQIGFGKKKSSGFGQFEVEWNEFDGIKEPNSTNAFIALGNYLPSADDRVNPIGYDINTKYGKLGEELSLSANPFKNPIIFLTAGSCFRTESAKVYYGRITEDGEISGANKFAVQFGMPMTLNFNL